MCRNAAFHQTRLPCTPAVGLSQPMMHSGPAALRQLPIAVLHAKRHQQHVDALLRARCECRSAPCPIHTCPPADNLQTRLYFATRYYHDFSVDIFVHLSVFSASSGVDVNIDNHKAGQCHSLAFAIGFSLASSSVRI